MRGCVGAPGVLRGPDPAGREPVAPDDVAVVVVVQSEDAADSVGVLLVARAAQAVAEEVIT